MGGAGWPGNSRASVIFFLAKSRKRHLRKRPGTSSSQFILTGRISDRGSTVHNKTPARRSPVWCHENESHCAIHFREFRKIPPYFLGYPSTAPVCSLNRMETGARYEYRSLISRISQPTFAKMARSPNFMAQRRRNAGGDGHEIWQSA